MINVKSLFRYFERRSLSLLNYSQKEGNGFFPFVVVQYPILCSRCCLSWVESNPFFLYSQVVLLVLSLISHTLITFIIFILSRKITWDRKRLPSCFFPSSLEVQCSLWENHYPLIRGWRFSLKCTHLPLLLSLHPPSQTWVTLILSSKGCCRLTIRWETFVTRRWFKMSLKGRVI